MKTEIEGLVAKINDKKEGQNALEALAAMATVKAAEPFLVTALQQILEASGDKSKNVRDAALAAASAILDSMSPFAVGGLVNTLLAGMGAKAKPAQKEAVLNIITRIAAKSPAAIGYTLVDLISPVAELTCDIKKIGEDRCAGVHGSYLRLHRQQGPGAFPSIRGGCCVVDHQHPSVRGTASRLHFCAER